MIHALLATTVKFDGKLDSSIVKRINGAQHWKMLHRTNDTSTRKKSVPPNENRNLEAEELTHEIRQYSMDICKQMKNKLSYMQRKEFVIRNDKGSVSKEQLYIDCNTAIYEYLRFYLINILKEEMNCVEDLSRRKIATDAENKQRSEVEAQYSIHFIHDDIEHKVHITFYYTKCSIWIQGSSSKIDNMTIAQFFTYNYLEHIKNIIISTVPLKRIGETLRNRIISFLDEDQVRKLNNGEQKEDKCSICNRKCYDNGKSMRCNACSKTQHFNCVNIKTIEERNLYLNGSERFLCSDCLPIYPIESHLIEDTNPAVQPTKDTGVSLQELSQVEPLPSNIDFTKETSQLPPLNSTDDPTDGSTSGDRHQSALNADKILIKRLQCQINKMVEEHTKKEVELNKQISTLKEAYRICLAKYEKEKDTKDTLQECVKALQAASDEKNDEVAQTDKDQHPKNKDEPRMKDTSIKEVQCRFFNRRGGCRNKDNCRFVHKVAEKKQKETNEQKKEQQKKTPQPCFFFNKRGGCRNGENCRFEHVQKPRCPEPTCNSRQCSLDHKRHINQEKKDGTKPACTFFKSTNGCRKGDNCRFAHNDGQASNQHFLPTSTENKPPDIHYTMKDIEDMVQKQIQQLMDSKISPKQTEQHRQTNPTVYNTSQHNQNQYQYQTRPNTYMSQNIPMQTNMYAQPTPTNHQNYLVPTLNHMAQYSQQIPIYSH